MAVLEDCSHWFVGQVEDTRRTGDHTAFLLTPVEGAASGPWQPLMFQDVKGFQAGHPT